ncbi:hypothetical protein KM043_008953 [Ampulex compressa]|nr:hypothetical protein KM043_008953 [Ampulex compressa]
MESIMTVKNHVLPEKVSLSCRIISVLLLLYSFLEGLDGVNLKSYVEFCIYCDPSRCIARKVSSVKREKSIFVITYYLDTRIMSNVSISSSKTSFYEPTFHTSEEQRTMLYQNIKLNLQEIQKTTREIDVGLKKVQNNVAMTASLLDAIKTKSDLDKS